MFRLLAPGARGPGVSEKTLKKQLRDEYGIDVELFKDVGEPAPPTDAEIDHAEAMMMKSQHVSSMLKVQVYALATNRLHLRASETCINISQMCPKLYTM